MKTVEALRQNLEAKNKQIDETQKERYRISQELTQMCYDNGKVMQATEKASRLKYELDIAHTTINMNIKEMAALRTEHERLRKSLGGGMHPITTGKRSLSTRK